MKFEFNESQLNNLIVFLDRTELKGIKEVQAFNEIMAVLNNPIKDEQSQEQK
jgi:hypothetical protein